MRIVATRRRESERSLPCVRLVLWVPVVVAHGRAKNYMSADAGREFVDANILVYAFDSSAEAKQATAARLLQRLWDDGTGCVSIQVLQEFFVTITRKVPEPLPVDEASDRVREFAAWKVFSPTTNDVLTAITLHVRAKINFWDAMIVQAATELGCDVLWSEDLKDQEIMRGVRIANPFALSS